MLAKGGLLRLDGLGAGRKSRQCSSRAHVDSHIEDTIVAGAGLNKRETVEFVVEHAPRAIERLAGLGVPFDQGEKERWHLTREGGHSHRRIVHVADATGWAVQQALEKAAADHPNVTLVPNMAALDLATQRHAETDGGTLQGGHEVGEKPRHVVVALVEREPGDTDVGLALGEAADPLGEDGRLAEPRRRGDQP